LEVIVNQWARETIDNVGENLQTLHSLFLAATEPTLFALALKHTGGNKAKAAELLGIHRGTLRDRLRVYGMDE
jgi:two-component system nitrogen regulation response regulator GlnG